MVLRTVTYHKKGDNVTVSVDPGESKADEWLCARVKTGKKTIPAVENAQEQKLEFTVQQDRTAIYDCMQYLRSRDIKY